MHAMPDSLTIFFYPAWYPHRTDSMFGLFVKQHAIAAALTNRVGVVFCVGENRANGPVYDAVFSEEEGVHTQRVYFKRSSLSLLNGWRYLRGMFLGYRLLRQRIGTAQVNHVHVLTRAGLLPFWQKITAGIPYVITEHWSRYQPRNKGMYTGALRKWLTKEIVKKASIMTVVSQNLAQAMQGHGLNHPHYRTIYNVADGHTFRPSDVKAEPKKIIHISCFEERSKNMSGIIRAIEKLSKQRTDFMLEMVGDGIDKPATEQLATEFGLKDRFVFFPGLQEGEALAKRLRESQFLLIYSHYENMPVVMNEAFMSGVPVLSSDVGGIREMLTEDKGILVPADDEEKLLQAINQMLNHGDAYNAQGIRAFAETHFSREALSVFLENLYREVEHT